MVGGYGFGEFYEVPSFTSPYSYAAPGHRRHTGLCAGAHPHSHSALPHPGRRSLPGQNPAGEQAMRTGEAAFSRRDFDEAIKNYFKAVKLEPRNYAAVLFIGNACHKKNDFARAGVWYEKAIRLDPNIETGYRYYAEMLA